MHFKLQSTSDAWAMLSPLIGALKALTHMCTHMHIHRVYIYMTLWHTLIARHLHEAIWFAKRRKTSCPKTSLWEWEFSDCDTINPNLLRVMTQGETKPWSEKSVFPSVKSLMKTSSTAATAVWLLVGWSLRLVGTWRIRELEKHTSPNKTLLDFTTLKHGPWSTKTPHLFLRFLPSCRLLLLLPVSHWPLCLSLSMQTCENRSVIKCDTGKKTSSHLKSGSKIMSIACAATWTDAFCVCVTLQPQTIPGFALPKQIQLQRPGIKCRCVVGWVRVSMLARFALDRYTIAVCVCSQRSL